MMRPLNFRFFSASPSDPPMSPAPMMVICRMEEAIEEFAYDA
jgi:hypothetical protein